LSLPDPQDLVETSDPALANERLIVCLGPLLAAERLLGAIGRRLGRVINRYRMAKHFRIVITGTGRAYTHREDSVRPGEALDGLHVIRTNVPADGLNSAQAVATYKSLS
jgi:hypothetical protein